LSFNGGVGDKISLWTDGTPTHYGFGIQSGLLQMFAKNSSDNIAFGSGNSSSFNERMRIVNAGANGLQLNGRMVLKNGTAPIDVNFSPGIWLYKADNSDLLGFIGTYGNQNMGFYGGPAGWGFTYDAINSRVGIGNTAPVERLQVAGNIKADTVKPNALKLTPNAGNGKVLTSDAAGNASWQTSNSNGSGVGFGAWGDCATTGNINGYNPVGDPNNIGGSADFFGST